MHPSRKSVAFTEARGSAGGRRTSPLADVPTYGLRSKHPALACESRSSDARVRFSQVRSAPESKPREAGASKLGTGA